MEHEPTNNKDHEQEQESAGKRLRRILSSNTNQKPKVTDISSKPDPEADKPVEEHQNSNQGNGLEKPSPTKKEEEVLEVEPGKLSKLLANLKTIISDIYQHIVEIACSIFPKRDTKKQTEGKPREKHRFIKIKDKKSCLIYTILGLLLVAIII